MPYGTVNSMVPKVSVTVENVTPTSSKVTTQLEKLNTFPASGQLNFSRYGKNAIGKKGSLIKRPPGTFERVVVSVPKGPRLPYKVWSKRWGKYVWARQPILVYALRRKKSQVKASKGLDLPPNRLSFSSSRVSYFGGDNGSGNGTLFTVSTSDARYKRIYKGDLWTDFQLLGTSTCLAPNPQNYASKTLSSRFTAAITDLGPKALSKLYSDVKTQKVNFAQALAERAQTASMILDLVTRLVTAVRKARHGNIMGAASVLFPKSSKELANDVLVYQYGISPLISDIKGCISLLSDQPELTFDVISRRTKKLPRELVVREVNMNGGCVTEVYSEGFVTVLYKCRVKVRDPFGQFLSDTGLSDVSLLAWELLPYSFLVDWLLPVGDYLQNSGAFANLEIVHLHKTEFAKEFITYQRQFVVGRPTSGYMVTSGNTCGFVNEKISCNRSVITTNLPKMPFPSFKDPRSAGHIINAIALLRQLV